MFRILNRCDQRKGAIAAVEFEGEPYGAGISFFRGDLPAGKDPGLHRHPYAETCIVFSGQVAMIADGKELVAGAGDIVIIGPSTPHRFTAIGDERLAILCVHASGRFVIEYLSEEMMTKPETA